MSAKEYHVEKGQSNLMILQMADLDIEADRCKCGKGWEGGAGPLGPLPPLVGRVGHAIEELLIRKDALVVKEVPHVLQLRNIVAQAIQSSLHTVDGSLDEFYRSLRQWGLWEEMEANATRPANVLRV